MANVCVDMRAGRLACLPETIILTTEYVFRGAVYIHCTHHVLLSSTYLSLCYTCGQKLNTLTPLDCPRMLSCAGFREELLNQGTCMCVRQGRMHAPIAHMQASLQAEKPTWNFHLETFTWRLRSRLGTFTHSRLGTFRSTDGR
eukprot:70244-Chlamydomonas_euryale.AAC.5